MPALEIDDLNKIQIDGLFEVVPTFVETGTFLGETIAKMEPFFETLHTIEIKQEFYLRLVTSYKGNKIKFHLGDSSSKLKQVCQLLETDTLFFLDGHWSAGITGRGEKDCPLYEELENIVKYCKHNCIIIIDDVRLFGKGPNKGNEVCNWENISVDNVLKIVNDRLTKHYFIDSTIDKKDRLILHLYK
uniref:Methyltransferase n=1 Tax=viral metagenome TaxID=1070528 RepID=A0A6C0JBQ9_9ZZZZ